MKNKKNKSMIIILIVYLAGIFMGALDTGIVTPARTIIQNNFNVDTNLGIWMITIYTLAYASSISIMGKLADKFGRKYIYLISISLFGLGSLLCGLSGLTGNFTFLLIARVIQAIGGGGILPIATAEFGTTFPQEKRGFALGLVGGVYGIANIFGASAGSLILDLFGSSNWEYIFYINVPITIVILIAGFIVLPNTKANNKKIDFLGISVLTIMVLSLMYGLKNIDFFAFIDTITQKNVYPYLLLFILLIPVFKIIEQKAEDPVLKLEYFKNKNIIITLALAFVSGFVMMGMIFVPQFSENVLKIASGTGGYFVIVLGIFAGVSAPLSGKLVDKYGPKLILGIGFLISIIGALFLSLITINYPTYLIVIIGLILVGFGMGFTIGTPLNYMMLDNTKKEDSNSALATLSLIRSIGTTIAPAIMAGFLAHAGMNIQTNVMNELPNTIKMPKLPYATELQIQINDLKKNPSMDDMLKDINIPNLQEIKIDFNSNSNYKMDATLIKLMQSSDVTTILVNSKTLAVSMFDQMTPTIIGEINTGLDTGIKALTKVPSMQTTIQKMIALKETVPIAFKQAKNNYLKEIDSKANKIETAYQTTLNKGFKQVYLTIVIASSLSLLVLIFYKKKK